MEINIKTKFNVGDEVYFIENNSVFRTTVQKIIISNLTIQDDVSVNVIYVVRNTVMGTCLTKAVTRNETGLYSSVDEAIEVMANQYFNYVDHRNLSVKVIELIIKKLKEKYNL